MGLVLSVWHSTGYFLYPILVPRGLCVSRSVGGHFLSVQLSAPLSFMRSFSTAHARASAMQGIDPVSSSCKAGVVCRVHFCIEIDGASVCVCGVPSFNHRGHRTMPSLRDRGHGKVPSLRHGGHNTMSSFGPLLLVQHNAVTQASSVDTTQCRHSGLLCWYNTVPSLRPPMLTQHNAVTWASSVYTSQCHHTGLLC